MARIAQFTGHFLKGSTQCCDSCVIAFFTRTMMNLMICVQTQKIHRWWVECVEVLGIFQKRLEGRSSSFPDVFSSILDLPSGIFIWLWLCPQVWRTGRIFLPIQVMILHNISFHIPWITCGQNQASMFPQQHWRNIHSIMPNFSSCVIHISALLSHSVATCMHSICPWLMLGVYSSLTPSNQFVSTIPVSNPENVGTRILSQAPFKNIILPYPFSWGPSWALGICSSLNSKQYSLASDSWGICTRQ